MTTSIQSFAANTKQGNKKATLSNRLFTLLFSTCLLFTCFTTANAQCVVTLTNTTLKHPSCGGSDGYFVVQVQGITLPYQFKLEKIVSGLPVVQTNGTQLAGDPTFVGLSAGTYILSVSKGGCTGSITVELVQEQLSLTAKTIKHPSCGGSDGYFVVDAGGITEPYQFVLRKFINGAGVIQTNGTQLAGDPTFVGLSAGTYQLEISKGGTCSGSITIELVQEQLTLTKKTIKQPSCGGSDGYFVLELNGITEPYQFKLEKMVNGVPVVQTNGTQLAGDPIFVGLSAGTYVYSASKGGTCSGSITVELMQEQLTLTTKTIKQPSCGASDGYFVVEAGGITEPYQFVMRKIINGVPVIQTNGTQLAGDPTFVGLSAGTYQLEISKGGTCSGSITVVLQEPPLTIAFSNLTPPSCTGTDGSFRLDVGGVVAPYPYTLSKKVNGSFVTQETGTLIAGDPTFVGLGAGIYQFTLAKGSCTGSITVYLNCETLGNEGCSPGYWKNQTQSWTTTNYSPTQILESVFDVPDDLGLDNTTLLQALQGNGGSSLTGAAQTLLRAAVAALLNAAHGDVDYTIKLQKIIADVNAALNSGDRNTMTKLASSLDKYNNKNCPLDASKKEQNRKPENSDLQVITSELIVKALPNPSAHYFNVQLEGGSQEKINIRVMDMQGRLIEQRTNVQPQQTIRLGDNYVPGVYLLDVQQGNTKKQLKLLKGFN